MNLRVRYRDCPNNNVNQPCRATNPDPNQGYAEGPMLNGVRSDHAIVINDGIPGPEIRAKLGDTIRVNVENLLGVPTTMHFHGMTQFRTPFMDGDEMVSNCPIQPGYSHTYEFVAHPAGTTFYHSHSGSQRVSGMTGPLIVEDQDEPFADAPDRLVFIQDWYNQVSLWFWQEILCLNDCLHYLFDTIMLFFSSFIQRRMPILTLTFGARTLVSTFGDDLCFLFSVCLD